MVVIAPSTNWGKTRISVHFDGGIPVADFKMSARYSFVSGAFKKIAKELTADAAAAVAVEHTQQEQFRFVRDRPE